VIVLQALLKLAPVAARGWFLSAVGLAALVAYFLGVFELVIMAAAGVLVVAVRAARRGGGPAAMAALVFPAVAAPQHTAPGELVTLFLTFLKIGAVLYGSGYVLLAFLRSDFVERLGWLTEPQLLDGVAIGQLTPGPLFTTATFVGFVTSGWVGAVVATVAIFLPSFVFVALLGRIVPWMRAHRWTGDLLDGVNVGALALMAGVSWQLGRVALVDGLSVVIALASALALWRTRWNSAWLIAAGALVGIGYELVRG
jgi:chromate transporter